MRTPSVANPALGSILALMKALGQFGAPSWAAWRVVLRVIFGLPIGEAEMDLYRRLTGRSVPPSGPFREVWLICGRRAGKSIITALIAVYQCTCRTFKRSAGELLVFMVIAGDRRQARVIKSYIAGMLRMIGALEELIETDTADGIVLSNGIRIEITTASFRTLRGYTCVGACCDEIAFWQNDDSLNPDSEILAALRPAMATQPDAILVCLTSPYARRGEVWKAYQKHYGKDDAPVLVVKGDTRTLNPEVPQAFLDQAYADDPAHAAAEYGAEFRTDVEGFVTMEAVEACRRRGVFELAPEAKRDYFAFTDPSGGSSDSMTLAIAYLDLDRVVVAAQRERTAPFDPDSVVREFADVMRTYRVARVHGDRYAGEWPVERFRVHGIEYRPAERTKSELYLALLPRLNAQTIDLLDHDKTVKQLVSLERRTARGGRESIDHPPSGKDDVANAVAGVASLARQPKAAVAFSVVEKCL